MVRLSAKKEDKLIETILKKFSGTEFLGIEDNKKQKVFIFSITEDTSYGDFVFYCYKTSFSLFDNETTDDKIGFEVIKENI